MKSVKDALNVKNQFQNALIDSKGSCITVYLSNLRENELEEFQCKSSIHFSRNKISRFIHLYCNGNEKAK